MADNKNTMNINFLVNKQIIKRLDTNQLVAGSLNYVVANFKFSSDWEGTSKKIFLQASSGKTLYLDLPEDNAIVIPTDILKYKGFRLALKGTLENGTIINTNDVSVNGTSTIITTNDVSVPVIESVCFEGQDVPIRVLNSTTLTCIKDGDTYKIDVPSSIIAYNKEDDTIHLKKLDGTDLTYIELPHKTRIDNLEE